MNKTRQSVEIVNFRLYFKVVIRQNETQYFTYSIYTEQESENTASREARDYLKLLSYIYMMELLHTVGFKRMSPVDIKLLFGNLHNITALHHNTNIFSTEIK